ncbi:MAG TPA: hypothetical protein GX520_05895 [Syntrophaceticus sp.]|nr:hypothetical protein [Syntrophaceticus sp.]
MFVLHCIVALDSMTMLHITAELLTQSPVRFNQLQTLELVPKHRLRLDTVTSSYPPQIPGNSPATA